MKILVTVKGGPGSGNWGHAGRPGLRGGSTSTGVGVVAVGDIAPGRQVMADTRFGNVEGEIYRIGEEGKRNEGKVQVEIKEDGKTFYQWVDRSEITSISGAARKIEADAPKDPVIKDPSMQKPAVNQVYHGTSADVADSILREGLRAFSDPELGRPPSVYYTEDEAMAARYGTGSLRGPGSRYAVITFELPEGYVRKADEIGSPGDWRVERSIPANAISQIEIFDSSGASLEVHR